MSMFTNLLQGFVVFVQKAFCHPDGTIALLFMSCSIHSVHQHVEVTGRSQPVDVSLSYTVIALLHGNTAFIPRKDVYFFTQQCFWSPAGTC